MYRAAIVIGLLLFAFILRIIFLVNTGGKSLFIDLAQDIPHGDKVGHLVLFGALALILNFSFKLRSFRLGRLKIYLGTALVLLFVIAEELSQVFFPTRTLDAKDLVADGVGLVAASLICFAFERWYPKKSKVGEV